MTHIGAIERLSSVDANVYCCPTAAIWRSIAKRPSHASRNGQGASELLHHVIARKAGRLAVDRRRDIVALFLIESWRLNTERRQCDPVAAASSALLFRLRQYPTANPCAAQILWQKEPGDIDEPKFGSPVEPADDFAGLRIADEHGERAKVVVSGLAQIIGAQTIANHRCVSGIQLI